MEELAPLVDDAQEKPSCSRCGKQFKNAAGLGMHAPRCLASKTVKEQKAPEPKQTKPAPKAPAAPRPAGKRVALDDKLSMAWGGLGSIVVPAISPAAARGMVVTAPAAGRILDDALARSKIDKLAQKYAGKGKQAQGLGTLVALPLILGLIEKQPALIASPAIQQVFRKIVEANVVALIDAQLQEKRKQEALAAKAAEAGIPLQNEDGSSLIDSLCNELLGPIFPTQSQPEERANV